MKRRTFLTSTTATVAALPWFAGCGGGGGGDTATTTPVTPVTPPVTTPPSKLHITTLTVDASAAGTAVNRRALGSNVQWVDQGDKLLDTNGAYVPTMLNLVKALAPTVLRYPGGSQADVFHWNSANNQHVFTTKTQPTLMNPQRLLEACEATGAEPLFTVNIVTGVGNSGADEAAAWVTATNVTRLTSSVTGQRLPKVTFWEIGNEPYLKIAGRADLDLDPAVFAARVNAFIKAMRAVDPSISIGLPLTLDTRNGLSISAYPNFAQTVLGLVTERFDFVCLHNAYLPLVFSGSVDVTALYPAAMAAAESVRDDFAATRTLLAQLRPGSSFPLAVTEHAPLFSLGLNSATATPPITTDDWATTPLGAMYIADLVRVFAATPDLLLANHWSLSGNGRFGAIGGSGTAGFNRAAADVLTLAGRALRGNLLPATVTCDTTTTPSVGLVAARTALPLLTAMQTREGSTLRTLLIHKDPSRTAQLTVNLSNATPSSVTLTVLSTASDANVTSVSDVAGLWQRAVSNPAVGSTASSSSSLVISLPPHSVALLELAL